MPYIHETKLNMDRKKLRKLGSGAELYKRAGAEGAEEGKALGSTIGNLFSKAKAKPDSAEQQLVNKAGDYEHLPEYKQQSEGSYQDLFKPEAKRGDYDFGTDDERIYGPQMQDTAHWGETSLPSAVQQSQKNLQVNGAAQLAPVNGEYTPQGQKAADQEAGTMATDAMTAKRLMRFGGMMNTPAPMYSVTTGKGNF